VFNTTASLQTRKRTFSYFKAAFACGDTAATTVYREVLSGQTSAVIAVNDKLYTNSAGTSALSSGKYGITLSSGTPTNVCLVATVNSSGQVTAVHDCQCGGGGGGGGGGLPPP